MLVLENNPKVESVPLDVSDLERPLDDTVGPRRHQGILPLGVAEHPSRSFEEAWQMTDVLTGSIRRLRARVFACNCPEEDHPQGNFCEEVRLQPADHDVGEAGQTLAGCKYSENHSPPWVQCCLNSGRCSQASRLALQ